MVLQQMGSVLMAVVSITTRGHGRAGPGGWGIEELVSFLTGCLPGKAAPTPTPTQENWPQWREYGKAVPDLEWPWKNWPPSRQSPQSGELAQPSGELVSPLTMSRRADIDSMGTTDLALTVSRSRQNQ